MISLSAISLLLLSLRNPSLGCNLPHTLQRSVAKAYPGWRPVATTDMDPADAAVWNRDHRRCPGILFGRFGPRSNPVWIVALINTLKHQEITLMLRKQGIENAVTVIDSAYGYSDPYIIFEEGPGIYKDVTSGRRRRLDRASFGAGRYGDSETLFYWIKGSLHHMIISE